MQDRAIPYIFHTQYHHFMAPSSSPRRSLSPVTPRPDSPPLVDHHPDYLDASGYRCQWLDCTKAFNDPEILYNHLCNDHIGRKSTNNLCLTCKWKDCGTSCAKRDHITSHLRGKSFSSLPKVLCLTLSNSAYPSQTSYL
jgi:hypothetical protein